MAEDHSPQSPRLSNPKDQAIKGGAPVTREPAPPQSPRRWSDIWEGLLRLGLGEVTMQAGTILASITLVLLVIWVMGSFYLKGNVTYERDKAIAAPLPTATATVAIPAYNLPDPNMAHAGVESTPEDFCFCMKTPRHITHDLRLESPAEEEMMVFVDASLALGKKFGPILVQLPPSFKADQLGTLAAFLQKLPTGEPYQAVRYAIEFRHASWYTPAVSHKLVDLLHQQAVCWVATDYENLPAEIHPTTDFLYLRWIGKHGVLPHPGEEVIDRTDRLREWLDLINHHLENAVQPVEKIFGFFDNDYAGHAPATCNRLKGMIGLPVTTSQAGEQGRLF